MKNQGIEARSEMESCVKGEGTAVCSTFLREVTAVYRGARRAVTQIKAPKCSADFIQRILPDNSREHFIALYLDGAHNIAAFSIVATGSANCCAFHPREVFQNAILAGAVSIIVGHNHPSGELTPSREDRQITARLAEGAKLLGIRFLDHVIVGDDDFYSFSQAGEM